MHQYTIIDIPSVESDTQVVFDVMVKWREVEIGKHLAGKVADGKATTLFCIEQALIPRKPVPAGIGRAKDAVICGVVGHHKPAKLEQQFPILFEIGSPDVGTKSSKKDVLVDGHEETSDVQFQHPPFPLVIMGTASHEMVQPRYGQMGAFPLAAGIDIIYQPLLDDRVQGIDDEVMHDTVPKGGCEYFPDHRLFDDEYRRFADTVGAVIQLCPELHEVLFEIHLERHGFPGVSFVLSARIIGIEHLFEGYQAGGK
jgi:hypothetical protein